MKLKNILNEGKRRQIQFQANAHGQIKALLKNLRSGRDYDFGVGSHGMTLLDIDIKYFDKILSVLKNSYIKYQIVEGKLTEANQKELSKIETWIRKSGIDYDDWDWDGKELTIFTKSGTEKYSKKDLKDERVFEGKINEGRPMFQDTPNELAYIDFKKWAYKNRKFIKKYLRKAVEAGRDPGTDIFLALRELWLSWATQHAKEWSRVPNRGPQGKDFGRALAVMMKKDNLIIAKGSNKLTDIGN